MPQNVVRAVSDIQDDKVRRFWVFVLMVGMVVSVQARHRKTVPQPPSRVQLSQSEARRLSYFYQEGIKCKLNSRLSEAHDLFQHCLSIDPTNPEALYEAAYLKFYFGEDSLGTEMFRRVVELDNSNPQYVQSLAAAYLARNQYDKAIPVIEHLSQLQTRRSDVLYQLVELYKTNGQTDDAIRAVERIEVLEGRSLQTSLQRYALYLDKGKKQEAFDVLEQYERESPYDLRIPMIRGKQYLQHGDSEAALRCFENVRRIDPQNEDLPLAMMEYYAQTGHPELRVALRDSLLYDSQTPDNMRVQMATQLIDDMKGEPNHHERIMQTLDTLVHLSNTASMHTLRVSYMMYSKVSDDSIANAMRDLLVVNPANENAQMRLVAYYLSKQDVENLAEVCRIGINTHPEKLTNYFYLALSQAQQKQNQPAIETLRSGIKQVDEHSEPQQVADFYALLGDILHEEGFVEESFQAYDSCLVYRDDNASCLNNYAYFLSLRNERLSDAERMSYRAIKLEPLNKTYLDTYAWVLFMQGNYTMARFYIDRVISPSQADSVLLADDDVHAEVLEHAGDIYALCDNVEQAMRYWSLAMQKGEGSALLEKKLKLKQYIKE